MTDREELARLLAQADHQHIQDMTAWSVDERPETERTPPRLIDAQVDVLASWLGRHDAEVAAKALEDAGAKLRTAAAREVHQGNSARYAQGIEDSGAAIIRTANSLRVSSLGAENPGPTPPPRGPQLLADLQELGYPKAADSEADHG